MSSLINLWRGRWRGEEGVREKGGSSDKRECEGEVGLGERRMGTWKGQRKENSMVRGNRKK